KEVVYGRGEGGGREGGRSGSHPAGPRVAVRANCPWYCHGTRSACGCRAEPHRPWALPGGRSAEGPTRRCAGVPRRSLRQGQGRSGSTSAVALPLEVSGPCGAALHHWGYDCPHLRRGGSKIG